MFELTHRRHGRKSTRVTTNKSSAEWSEVFPNAACVVALIDRLVHNAGIIHIKGGSYRPKEARERAGQRAKKRKGARPQGFNMKTCHQPSGLTQGLDFLIDSEWAPEQALAVVGLLDGVKGRILVHYQLPTMKLVREGRGGIGPSDGLDATDVWRGNGQPF